MKAKLPSSLPSTRTALFALALICSSSLNLSPFFSTLSFAQEIDFQKSIDSTSEALIELDVLASDCIDALDSDENSQLLCDQFLNGIDGELMANYLEQCRVLKNWRDEYVNETVASTLATDSDTNEEMLRRLISIEFTCGENTLQDRTQFVFIAFNRLRNESTASSTSTATLNRELNQRRFDALENSERQRLQNALQNQQRRSQRESDRQIDDLENELLRQQIRNSNPVN